MRFDACHGWRERWWRGAFGLGCAVWLGWVWGCAGGGVGGGAAGPGVDAGVGAGASFSASEPGPGWVLDVSAIERMSGVFEVTFLTAAEGRSGPAVTAREAVLREPGSAAGEVVLEHLLLVGEPVAVARHWSEVWTPMPSQRGGGLVWRVRVNEADGRPTAEWTGRWLHESGPAGPGAGGGGGVSRFVGLGGERRWTSRNPGLGGGLEAGSAGDWWASTTVRVGPGLGWSRVTEGQLRGASAGVGGAGGVVVRSETYRSALEAEAGALSSAEAWWAARRGFWAAVRGWWDGQGAWGSVAARASVDGLPMWRAVLDLEAAVRRGERTADGATLDVVLGRYLGE